MQTRNTSVLGSVPCLLYTTNFPTMGLLTVTLADNTVTLELPLKSKIFMKYKHTDFDSIDLCPSLFMTPSPCEETYLPVKISNCQLSQSEVVKYLEINIDSAIFQTNWM